MTTHITNIVAPDGLWTVELDLVAKTAKVLAYAGHQPPPTPSVLQRAHAWMQAEASLRLHGPVPDAEYDNRIARCQACPELEPLMLPQIGRCRACGCGNNPRAELSIKARMPAATCPRALWESATLPPSGAAT
jgi:hypothetical protein